MKLVLTWSESRREQAEPGQRRTDGTQTAERLRAKCRGRQRERVGPLVSGRAEKKSIDSWKQTRAATRKVTRGFLEIRRTVQHEFYFHSLTRR